MKKFFGAVAMLMGLLLLLLAGCTKEPSATLSKSELSLTVGAETSITAVLENCTDGTAWVTSDENVVTLSWEGPAGTDTAEATVKAVGTGTATVSLMLMDKVLAACTVTVSESPLKVFLPEGNLRLVLLANGVATVRAMCDVPVEGEPVWTSADEKIGTVEAQGLTARVKALARGQTVITVRYGEYSASFELLVGRT